MATITMSFSTFYHSVKTVLLVLSAGIAAGVMHYFFALSQLDHRHAPHVDAAIVLTGGPDRLADAAHLLESGVTTHLLITGVGGKADVEDLVRVVPALAPFATCCIDLDREALNTRGNAKESIDWARQRNFSSLAIVTAGFHLPRAMLEFRAIAPDFTLY